MTAPASSLSTDDWIERLRPAFDDSLDAVSDRITSQAAVQRWLHDASFDAAASVAQYDGMQAEAMGYMHMVDDLEAQFPALVDAVRTLTDGCGTLDLNWRPLTPNFSRVYVDFRRDFTVKAFTRLDAPTREAAERAVQHVARRLPAGSPYPNRPHVVTGIVSCGGRCVGVRVKKHLGEGGATYHTVTLFPPNAPETDALRPGEAVQWLLRYADAESDPESDA